MYLEKGMQGAAMQGPLTWRCQPEAVLHANEAVAAMNRGEAETRLAVLQPQQEVSTSGKPVCTQQRQQRNRGACTNRSPCRAVWEALPQQVLRVLLLHSVLLQSLRCRRFCT